MKLSYEDFKANPVTYLTFLLLVVVSFLYFQNARIGTERIKDKNVVISSQQSTIDRFDSKFNQKDSIINQMYYLLGMKHINDKLNQE